MKKDICAKIGLGILAAVGLAAGWFLRGNDLFAAVMQFPLAPIGRLLRMLSLSGSVGNIAASALYAAIGLIPLAILAASVKKRGFAAEDTLLVILSPLIFAALYLMINPALMPELLGETARIPQAGKVFVGGVCWAVAIGYAALRLVRAGSGGREKAERCMTILLYILSAVFILAAFGGCWGEYLNDLRTLDQNAVDLLVGRDIPVRIFLTIKLIGDMLPYILDAIVALAAIRLMDALRTDRDGDAPVEAAERLSRISARALAATTVTGVAIDLIQLLFARALPDISIDVLLPLPSIAFVLATLLAAGLIRERKSYCDDSASFI